MYGTLIIIYIILCIHFHEELKLYLAAPLVPESKACVFSLSHCLAAFYS